MPGREGPENVNVNVNMHVLVKKQIETATDMLSKGGDWERRNRLKARLRTTSPNA